MKKLQTEIAINAPAETVWSVLTDFEKFGEWNPFIKSITGDKFTGGKLTATLQPAGSNGMKFKPAILRYEENRELRWKGNLLVGGIFDGEHFFILEKVSDSSTRFIHGEIFTGILVPFVGAMLTKTKQGFEMMNEALKLRCEKS
ncbi:MAG: SRPBCC domain-containing protein [Bacteroidetes bacterium]|nr:SRPBCC domain-containing protein [Bacteroidota bacterium]